MVQVPISVTVTNVSRYWVTINDTDVVINRGRSQPDPDLPEGQRSTLVYWFESQDSTTNASITIKVKRGNAVIFQRQDSIPAGYDRGAGHFHFTPQ